jgi:hypothetical protein
MKFSATTAAFGVFLITGFLEFFAAAVLVDSCQLYFDQCLNGDGSPITTCEQLQAKFGADTPGLLLSALTSTSPAATVEFCAGTFTASGISGNFNRMRGGEGCFAEADLDNESVDVFNVTFDLVTPVPLSFSGPDAAAGEIYVDQLYFDDDLNESSGPTDDFHLKYDQNLNFVNGATVTVPNTIRLLNLTDEKTNFGDGFTIGGGFDLHGLKGCVLPPPGNENTWPRPSTGGDPHFKRFGQTKRSTFHGECDMLLLESVLAGVAVHIRTTLKSTFSFIEQAVIKIGDATLLEFHQDALFVNGQHVPDDVVTAGAVELPDEINLSMLPTKKNRRSFQVDLANGLSFVVSSTKYFMSVNLDGDISTLTDAVGMFGEYGTGDLYGRDGHPISDYQEYGHEWQVHPEEDGQLFMEARAPQWPQATCNMPVAQISRRRLRANHHILYEDGKAACSASHPEDVDLCIDDVLMTGGFDVLESW